MAPFPLAARAKITVHRTGNTVYMAVRKEASLNLQTLSLALVLVVSRGSVVKSSGCTYELGDPK